MSRTTHHITDVTWVKAEAANRLGLIAALNARRTVEQVVSDPQKRQQLREEIVASRQEFVKLIETLQALVTLGEGKDLLTKIEEARGIYVKSQVRFYELLDAGDEDAAIHELQTVTLVVVQPHLAGLRRHGRAGKARRPGRYPGGPCMRPIWPAGS